MNTFTGSASIVTLEQARAYCKRRMIDAVACYKEGHAFNSPIELAKYLARYW